jgi:hypothetical protein
MFWRQAKQRANNRFGRQQYGWQREDSAFGHWQVEKAKMLQECEDSG